MKKVLLGLLLGFTALAGYSQTRWDVKAGMSVSSMTQLDGGPKVGYTVGIGVDHAFNKTWSLQSGINFTGKGTRETDSERGEKEKFQVFSHYVELPILAALKFRVAEQVRMVVNAGPYLAVGLGGKQKYSNTRFPETDSCQDLFEGTDGNKALMKRLDVGLQYGVGTELNEHFLIHLTGQCGFITPYNAPYHKIYGDDGRSPLNLSFLMTLGYRF